MTVNQHLLSAIHTLAFAWSRSFPIVTSNLHKHSKDSSSLLLSSFTTQSCMMLSVNICTKTQWQWETRIGSNIKINHNRPFPNCLVPLFQSEASCKTFHMKMSFICTWMKTLFDMKDYAPRLTLRKRHKATRKWSIGSTQPINHRLSSDTIFNSPHILKCVLPSTDHHLFCGYPKNIDFPL